MAVYKPLSADQVQTIAADYFERHRNASEPQAEPTITLVGGQPGAGKSEATFMVKSELTMKGGFLHVDADRLREEIPLQGGKPTSEETQADAGRLAGALRRIGIAERRNIIEEGTFRKPDEAAAFIGAMRSSGYRVEVVAVATPREESLLGIYVRHEKQHADPEIPNPRFVRDAYHDEALEGFGRTLSRTATDVDRVRVADRTGAVLHDSAAPDKKGNALEALAAGRSLSDAKLSQILTTWQAVEKAAEKRGAPPAYMAAVAGHAQRVEDLQKDRIHVHAMARLDVNTAQLASDPRYRQHSGGELLKAAYFRGFHESASGFKGAAPDFEKYDATAANRATLRQLPDVADLEGRAVRRPGQANSRDQGGNSL